MAPPRRLVNIDEVDGDWIKRGRWDLPATNLSELRAWLAEHGMTVSQFKRLDVYKANVKRLRWLQKL